MSPTARRLVTSLALLGLTILLSGAYPILGPGVPVSLAQPDPLPELSINDINITEGNSGFSVATFTIRLTPAASQAILVQTDLSDGSASFGSDFFPMGSVVSFDAGETSKPISVQVLGDRRYEPDETFFVDLLPSTQASIVKGRGVATILNDDPAPLYLPFLALPPPLPRLPVVADADILAGRPTTNFDNSSSLWTGNHSAFCTSSPFDGGTSRGLLRFDLSSVPANVSITKATLYLRAVSLCRNTRSIAPISAYRVTESWSASAVTWENQPPIGEAVGSVDIPLAAASLAWHTLDVTEQVRRWAAGAEPNYGLMLRTVEDTGPDFAFVGFASSNWSGYEPYIEVVFSATPGSAEVPLRP